MVAITGCNSIPTLPLPQRHALPCPPTQLHSPPPPTHSPPCQRDDRPSRALGGAWLAGRAREGGVRGQKGEGGGRGARRGTTPVRAAACGLRAPCTPTALQRSFGAFYRITQLILTTTPAANSSAITPSGLPAIVTGGQRGSRGSGGRRRRWPSDRSMPGQHCKASHPLTFSPCLPLRTLFHTCRRQHSAAV